MTTLTLLTKINSNAQLKQISNTLNFSLNGLEVETKVLGEVADGWVQVAVAGEDESVATNYLIKKIGLCPSNFTNINEHATLKGYIKNVGKNATALSVDVGVFQPKIVDATLALRDLQAQLVDDRKIALKKIAELFGLCEDLPVNVKVANLDEEENRIEVKLANEQIEKYTVWRESLLDRLLVLGASAHEINKAIKHAKLERDVIDTEHIGLLEHALTCKLGTDATGLIPKIGRNLKNSKFIVFNPKALRAFLKTEK
jgi:hypothetical protein